MYRKTETEKAQESFERAHEGPVVEQRSITLHGYYFVVFSWKATGVELQGVFDHPDKAEAACYEASDVILPVALNKAYPRETTKNAWAWWPRDSRPEHAERPKIFQTT